MVARAMTNLTDLPGLKRLPFLGNPRESAAAGVIAARKGDWG
jgi:hypothetical protein